MSYLCMADGDCDDRRRSTKSAVRRLSRCDWCDVMRSMCSLLPAIISPQFSSRYFERFHVAGRMRQKVFHVAGRVVHPTLPSLQCCLTRTLPIRNESIALNPILRPLIYDCYSSYPMQHHCSSKSCFTK